jgi:dipeptidyl-peptidase-3
LGYPGEFHVSGYYSQDITEDEISAVQSFLDSKEIRSENTRLTKKTENEEVIFELLVASADTTASKEL